MHRVALACGIGIGLLVSSAGAESAARVRLVWIRGDGAASCLDQNELKSRVRERLGRDPFADDAPLSIEGTVVREDNSWRADVRIHSDTRVLIGRRQLDTTAADCGPLNEAVILAVALTIDPDAALRPSNPSSAAFPPPPAPPPAHSPPAEPPPATLPAAVADARPIAEPRPDADERESVEVLGRAGVTAGILPRIAPLAGIAASYGTDSLRLTLDLGWLPEQASEDGRFAFGLTFGSAGGCYGVRLAADAAARLCAELQVGALHAVVRDLEHLVPLDPGDHLWLAAGTGPRLSWQLGAPLRLEAGLQAVVPIVRKAFALRGSSELVFRSELVSGAAYVGIGVGVP